MSKPVKDLITADYRRRFGALENALVVDIRGIEANENNDLRIDLHEQNITITVVKNSLARKALADSSLDLLLPAIDGPSALCYGGESVVEVARALVAWSRKIKNLDLKAAILDGEYFDGEQGVKKLSQYPTREEAQGIVVQLVLAPAGRVMAAVASGATSTMGIVKEIQEQLEDGKDIRRVG